MNTIEKVTTRAVELGVYLPLGAYAKVRDELTELRGVDVRQVIDDFVDRGHERLAPVEQRLRRRTTETKRTVTQKTREAQKTAARTTAKARQTGGKTAARGKATAASQAPKTTSAGLRPSDVPIGGYSSLNVDEIVPRLGGLTQTDLTKVRAFEKANQNRSTILDAIDAKMLKLPIPDYDALTVEETADRLNSLDAAQLKTLRDYEESTRNRSTVLDKIDARLS